MQKFSGTTDLLGQICILKGRFICILKLEKVALWHSCSTNKTKPAPRHIMVKLLKTKDKEKSLCQTKGGKKNVLQRSKDKNYSNILVRSYASQITTEWHLLCTKRTKLSKISFKNKAHYSQQTKTEEKKKWIISSPALLEMLKEFLQTEATLYQTEM